MADEFDRAQEQEERDRQIMLAEQQRRAATTPGDECRECGEDLAEHRKQYGICVDCKSAQEMNERHFRKGN